MSCGTQLGLDRGAFCPACGTSVSIRESAAKPEGANGASGAVGFEPEPLFPASPGLPTGVADYVQPQKRSAKRWLMWATVGVVALTGLVVAMFFLVRGSDETGVGLFPVTIGDRAGYIDRNGKLTIQAEFAYAGDFSEGLAITGLAKSSGDVGDNSYGYVDRTGNWAIQPQFDWARDFSDGLALVEAGGETVYIDRTGKVVIRPRFEVVNAGFSEGLAVVANGEWPWDMICGYIDKTGKLVIQPSYDLSFQFHEGLAAASLRGKWGFIDKTGEWVIDPQFYDVGPPWAGPRSDAGFSEGLVPVKPTEESMYGFMERTGRMVIEPQFEQAHDFSEGLAAVSYDGRTWGYINKTGKMVIQPQLDWAWDFSEGLAKVRPTDGGPWGFIDKTGKMVIQPRFEDAWSFSDGLAFVNLQTEGAYIDKKGNIVWTGPKRWIGE
jgi:hypothetical protein